jgi:transglutaminase-like putative cysteine protease
MIILMMVTTHVYSQPEKVKFGKIDKKTLAQNDFPDYPDAEAIILYDCGQSNFKWVTNTGFVIEYERHVRIKILKDEGFDWASFEIPLYVINSDEEKLFRLKAETHNMEEGKVESVKLDKDAIYKEDYNERWKLVKFTMPEVTEGSLIEVTYTIQTEYISRLRDWTFQYEVPVLWSEYRVEIPEYFRFNRNMRGIIDLAIYEETFGMGEIEEFSSQRTTNGYTVSHSNQRSSLSYQTYIYHYAAENIPALEEEPYMPSIYNYQAGMEFELVSIHYPNEPVESISRTWEDLNQQLLEEPAFGAQLNRSGYASDVLENIIQTGDDDQAKMIKIYEMVKDRMKWNGEKRVFATTSVRAAYKDRKGSSADINLMLVALLREAGVEAYPVLVSTRRNGLVTMTRPTIEQFNYVIGAAMIGENMVLLDATDPYCVPGLLPERCLNLQGRLVNKKDGDWVSLIPSSPKYRMVAYDISISPEGMVSGNTKFTYKQYAAYDERSNYHSFEDQGKYVDDLLYDIPGLAITDFETIDLDSLYKSFSLKYHYEIEGYAETAGDLLFFNPLVFTRVRENLFTEASERQYPVDFKVPIKETISATIKIPEGYEIDAIPETKVFVTPDKNCIFRYNVTPLGKLINLTCTMDIKETIFNTDMYPYIYEFYKGVVETEDEQIVLKKM